MANVKMIDIARGLGLSVATVSRALNPATAHLISEDVRLKIQNIAVRMGYEPHGIGRPASGRSYTLGVALTTDFHSHFFSDQLTKVVEGIYLTLKKHPRYGCKLVLLSPGKSVSEIDRYIVSSQIDGLLISTQCDLSVDELYRLAERVKTVLRKPVAAMNLPPRKGKQIAVLSFNNRKAAEKAVSYLIKRGRRRIGLVYADNNAEDIRERIEGFKEALTKHRLPVKTDFMAHGDFSVKGGEQAAREICRRNPSCDALFCVNDEMAIGAMSALRRLKKRCPEEVAVMGFDGLAAGELVQPRLTTVAQPLTEMAALACQVLIDDIEGIRSKTVSATLPAKIILRDSA